MPSKKLLHTAALTAPAMMTIDIPGDHSYSWLAWSKQNYDHFQPFLEIIDNALAAILTAAKVVGSIHIRFNFEEGVGSIEHSGGTTFPLDLKELVRCFIYGGKKVSQLNEHGCGLNTSLAILDPSNTLWKIFIKYVGDDGTMKVKSIGAPYASKMTLSELTEWPGENKSVENGSFIQFPLSKDGFAGLYKKKTDLAMKDIHKRITYQFTHMWMKVTELIDGKIQIFYNGERLVPFSFNVESVSEYIKSLRNTEFQLPTNAKIQVQHVQLDDKASSSLPGSFIFKKAMCANGAYLFKNGRFIESITKDEPSRGNLYTSIFDSTPHNNHNGNIVIVNMVGTQDQLPPTVPTKNRFQGGTLFDELINLLHDNIDKPGKSSEEKEATITEKYMKRQENILRRHNPHATFEQEKKFPLPAGNTTAPIDWVVTFPKYRRLIEFKRGYAPKREDILQLFGNYLQAKVSPENEGLELRPELVYQATADKNNIIPPTSRHLLERLSIECGFNPEILNTNDEVLWPMRA